MEEKQLLKLVEKARRGNQEAFSDLIRLKARRILFITTNLMDSKADAEDAAQEAVIVIGRDISKLKKPRYFDTWMYRVVFNVCMDEKEKKARKQKGEIELGETVFDVSEERADMLPHEKLESAEKCQEVLDAINELPERYRMCLVMYFYEGFSYGDIANTLQVSEQVVANTLYRAKVKLRISLEGEGEGLLIGGQAKYAAGSTIPAMVLTQAFAASEEALPAAAVAKLSGIAASAPVSHMALLGTLAAGLKAKAAVVALTAVVACSIGVVVYSDVQAFSTAAQPDAAQETVVERQIPSVQIKGLPQDATTTILVEGEDREAWSAFEADRAAMQYVMHERHGGYRYTVYTRSDDPLAHVVTIENETAMS